MDPGCDGWNVIACDVCEELKGRLVQTMDHIHRGQHRSKQLGPPLEQTLGEEIEIVLVAETRDDLLAHLANDPPGEIRDQQDSRLSVHIASIVCMA
jgi:hypothetical protein